MDANQSMFNFVSQSTMRLDSKSATILFYGKYIRKDEFFEKVERVAGYLQNLNIKKGDNVVLCLGNIPNAIICFYAINKIGAIINVVHPLITSQSLKEISDKMNPAAYVVFDEFFGNYPWIAQSGKPVIVCSASDYLPVIAKQVYPLIVYKSTKNNLINSNVIKFSKIKKTEYRCIPPNVDGQDIAVYMHSGGTTDTPKTVEMSNLAFNNLAINMYNHIGMLLDGRFGMLMALPIFHTFGLGVCMHTILSLGALCIMMPKFNGKRACAIIKKYDCRLIAGVPNMYKKMVFSGKFNGKKISKLFSCYCGGDKLDKKVYDKFASEMRKVGSDLVISEGYGLTEACVCAINKLDNYKFGSIGLPATNNQFAVIDENEQFLPPNQKGMLVLNSNTVMSGYYNDPIATKNAFFVDKSGTRWLKTGDIGYIDQDGFIFFVDRQKRLIKISGINVFPQEIENQVKTIAEVFECCAVEINVEGKSAIKLFVQAKDINADKKHLKDKIINNIKQNMLKYCVPAKIEFLDNIPLTQIGKVDFKKLADQKDN